MAITLSDDKGSDHKSKSDQEGNFMTFTTTIVVSDAEIVKKNPYDRELSENVPLQEV